MARIAEQLSFAYPPLPPDYTPQTVLHGIDLSLDDGEWVVLLGTTGCGKTTLCWTLVGLAPQLTGGTLAGTLQRADGHSIGFVFQDADAQLFSMTVADEIAFGLETAAVPRAEMQALVRHWLSWARLDGLDERAPWQLSGGQKKRLALASVLALSPRVLVLDDPTAGLDPAGTQEVAGSLNDLRHAGQHAVFLATADPELAARYADRVLVMDAGRIVMEGTPAEIFRQVQRLASLGISAPQMARLADLLRARGADCAFHDLDGAARALRDARAAPAVPTRSSAPPPAPAAPAILTYEDVSFHYPDGGDVLRGVSFSLAPGSFTALVGANGSGKTTLAKHANGLLRPSRGRVLFNGADIARRGTAELARQVGYVFQNPDHQIFAPTVRDEIAFGLRNIGLKEPEIAARVDAALEAFDLRAQAARPPAVLNFGARRLVTLAAVWAMRPALWVLDEPTTGLDERHAEQVMQSALAAQQRGATILLISHDMTRVATYAQRMVIVDEGRVLADGTPVDVLSDAALLSRARLAPPPALALARRLGWEASPLTIEDVAASLCGCVNPGGTR